MFERIVVAVDGSEPALLALKTACDLAGKYDSELHLVHSPQVETTAIATGAGAVEIKPTAEQIAVAGQTVIAEAEKVIAAEGGTLSASVIGEADPAHDVLTQVEAVDADLVVMGRRGLGNIAGLLLGSVSAKVSHDAKCTCMTVR